MKIAVEIEGAAFSPHQTSAVMLNKIAAFDAPQAQVLLWPNQRLPSTVTAINAPSDSGATRRAKLVV